MGVREQRVSEAAKRHPRQAPQKVWGRAKSEFQGEEDQRTKAETVVQRPQEQSVERAAKSNRITVNRAARGRLRQDIAAQSGGPKQIRRDRRCLEGVTAWLKARSGGPCFPTGNTAVKEREEQHRAAGQSRSGESPPGPQDRISFCPAEVFGRVCSMAHGEVSGRTLSQ